MTLHEFAACTWREFVLKFQGLQQKRTMEFELVRPVAYYSMINVWDFSKKPPPKMEEWWPLDTDEKVEESDEYLKMKELLERAKTYKFN